MPLTLKNFYRQYYEFNYDFRNKATALMENDGWEFVQNKEYATFDSNGINSTRQDRNVMAKVGDLTRIMPNANKITISFTGMFINKLRGGCGIFNTLSTPTVGETSMYASLAESGISTIIYGTGVWTSIAVSGEVTFTLILDLLNGTWTASATNGYSNSGAISSTDVNDIRNNTTCIGIFGISFGGGGGSSAGGLTTMSIRIE